MAVALAVAAFLYFYKLKKGQKKPVLLFVLRFLSIFALLLLLWNPKWEKHQLYVEKPILVVAVDNSSSIENIGATKKVKDFLNYIKKDKDLQDKFTVNYLSFGEQVTILDSLNFTESQTNPTELLSQVDKLYKDKSVPVLLITDGNQTYGVDYQYYQTKNIIYPIVVGDTLHYEDIQISQLNVNQYSLLDNKFPVEVLSLYKGAKTIRTQLSIYQGNRRIATKNIQFDKEHLSQKNTFTLTADKVGLQFYRAVLSSIDGEKNIQNNKSDFSVEVIDQQADILLLSSFNHPDLGAIKKSIESNKQRKVTLKVADFSSIKLNDYQLVILYQPTGEFSNIFKKINKQNNHYFLITGTQTDWHFLNTIQQNFTKNTTQTTEDFLPLYNAAFPEFVTKDIGFSHFPPLKDKFGTINFKVPYQTLLFQKIGNIPTKNPLLITFSNGQSKNVVLFGEGLWKWRMQSSIEHTGSKPFDYFFGGLIQFASKHKQANQIHLTYDKICYSNQEQKIIASYVDQNFQIDSNALLKLELTKKNTKKTIEMPFASREGVYQVVLSDLESGSYTFKVLSNNSKSKAYGAFKVLDYNIEQQYNTAAINQLHRLATNTNTVLTTIDTPEKLFENLKNDNYYKSVQKSKKIVTPIIDWYWLLGFIIVSLSIEWFIRKYRGLI